MKKTLVRFFGGGVMVCGSLLGLAASAHAQTFDIVPVTQNGPAHQSLAQTIHITNLSQNTASNVMVTFRAPKGTKVDSDCQVDHLPGGLRSYSCALGSISPGQEADINFSFSTNQSGTFDITVQVNGDQVSGGGWFTITIF